MSINFNDPLLDELKAFGYVDSPGVVLPTGYLWGPGVSKGNVFVKRDRKKYVWCVKDQDVFIMGAEDRTVDAKSLHKVLSNIYVIEDG